MRGQSQKSLSMFRQLLKTILIPLLVVALSLMILLPIFAVLLVQLSSQKIVEDLFYSVNQTFTELQVKMDELSESEAIHYYLETGDGEIAVYEELYHTSNTSQYNPYFYLTDTTLEKEAIYQPTSSVQVSSILNLVNIRRLMENPNEVLQLTNTKWNKNFTASLVFGKAIYKEGQCLGYLIMNYYPTQVESLIGQTDQNVIFMNHQSRIVYSNSPGFTTESNLVIQQQFGPFVEVNGNLYLYRIQEMHSVNLTIITLVSLGFVPQIILAVLVALLFSSVIAIIVFVIFRKRFSKDVFTMLDDMFLSLGGYQDSGELVPVRIRNSSMTDYIEQYNSIVQEVQNLIERNNQLVQDTTSAQIKQLQSQFNPHFIFNTLASVQVMVHKDPEAANSMIHKLATMLRYSIRFGEENRVLLKDDIEYLKDYLSLQKIRFQELLEYQITIEDSDFLVPKLILQPIIENSIQHGFVGDSLFLIEIAIYHIKDDLVMIVRDNGCGMKKSKLKTIQRLLKEQPEDSAHIGLVNCHRRLQLFYGEQYGVTIDSIEGKGTTIVLTCKAERKT